MFISIYKNNNYELHVEYTNTNLQVVTFVP